ncbi:MAG: hypothetical protein WC728_06645 [Elusimicrobiota bacterium]
MILSLLAAVAVSSSPYAEIDRLYSHRDQVGNLERTLSLLEGKEDPQALWRLGRSLLRQGERAGAKREKVALFTRAEETARRAAELAPTEPEALYWQGVAMGRRGQARGMMRSLFMVGPLKRLMRKALELEPKHAGAHQVLGEMLMALPGFAGGSKKEAVAELEASVRSDPSRAASYTALAEAYLGVGRREDAERVLREVEGITAPDDPAEFQEILTDAREMLSKISRKP